MSVLEHTRHDGPLRILRPYFPEGPERPHFYILHPPGGLVCGDQIDIRITSRDRARALFTTPSAGKVYRTDTNQHAQIQRVEIDCTKGGQVEWLPQENIIFDGANALQHLQIRTDSASRFVAWDVTALGRPASGEPFLSGHFEQITQVFKYDRLGFTERLQFGGGGLELRAAWGLQGRPVYGTLVCGHFSVAEAATVLTDLRQALPEGETDGLFWAATRKDSMILLRAAGLQSEGLKRLFRAAWSMLRPAISGSRANPPRIWAT